MQIVVESGTGQDKGKITEDWTKMQRGKRTEDAFESGVVERVPLTSSEV